MKQAIDNIVEQNREELIQFTQELIRIKSMTTYERELAQMVEKKMKELGYDEVIVDPMGNVIGRIGDGEIKILYDSHMDTVEVNDADEWISDPFGGEIIDGKMYGRGTVDMKSSIAATVFAGHAIKSMGYDKGKTIYVSASVMEEDYDGEALEYILTEGGYKPDYVVICEPSSLNVALGHRGRALLKVDVDGVAAHGSAPEKGDNAVYKMNIIIDRIEKKAQQMIQMSGEKGSLALTRIESKAVSLNAIPDHCSIYLDRRLIVGEDYRYISNEMANLLEGTQASWQVYDVEGTSYTGKPVVLHSFLPAWEIEEDHSLTVAAQSAYRGIFDEDPVLFKWDFCTNGVASMGKCHVPTIGFGPGDPKLAHKRDEHCLISDLLGAYQFYTVLPSCL